MEIEEKPFWMFTPRRTLTLDYEHVHLLPEKVVGQWFCLNRADGTLVWERSFWRPTSVVAIQDNVIIAYESEAGGCYGISLDTGRLLWTSHGRGLWGRFLRLLDFIPGFTNDLRDRPKYVEGQECVCYSGRVIDFHSGRDLRRISKKQVEQYRAPKSDAYRLYERDISSEADGIGLAHGKRLSHRLPGTSAGPHHREEFILHLLNDDDSVLWSFNLSGTGYHIDGNFYSYRYHSSVVFLVVSEEKKWKPHATKALYVVHNPTRYHLLALDLDEGGIVQDVLIDQEKVEDCRLEDIDDAGMLVSLTFSHSGWYPKTQLRYYGLKHGLPIGTPGHPPGDDFAHDPGGRSGGGVNTE